MPSTDPLISVVMPVYNADEYLAESIESILNQTFRDFELIIVCDDPSDRTREIINTYQKIDYRIIVFYQKREGLIASLNTGCSIAKGKYIARMDADDISLPERFEKQVVFLEDHPDAGVCGTWVDIFSDDGSLNSFEPPDSPLVINFLLLFNNCVAHPSVMMTRKIIQNIGYYNKNAQYYEDYELWIRTVNVTNIYNIPLKLVRLRQHKKNVSELHKEIMKQEIVPLLQQEILKNYNFILSKELVYRIRFMDAPLNNNNYRIIVKIIYKMFYEYKKNHKITRRENKIIKNFFSKRFFYYAIGSIYENKKIVCWFLINAMWVDPSETIKLILSEIKSFQKHYQFQPRLFFLKLMGLIFA